MKLGRLPAGAKGCDTSARVSFDQARALRGAGMAFVLRSVGHSTDFLHDNLDADELAMLVAEGLAVGCYQLYRREGWSTETGAADGHAAVDAARAAGLPPGCVLWCDLEGNSMSHETLAPYAQAWRDVVQGDGTYFPGAYRVRWAPETPVEIRSAGFAFSWDAADGTAPIPGSDLAQGHQTTVAGVIVDPDTAGAAPFFAFADEAPVTLPTGATPSTIPAPPPGAFTFTRRDGEAPGEAMARCWEEALAGGRMGHTMRPDWYKSFINATHPAGTLGGHPVADIAAWATSCLITQEAALHHIGWQGPPPRNGAGFYEVLGMPHVHGDGPFQRGDIAYYANTGTDGHVVCLLEQRADGVWRVAGGGGGHDGTECDFGEFAHGQDHYGRRRQGAWRPALLLAHG